MTGVPVGAGDRAGRKAAWINERYIRATDQHIALRGNELGGQFASILRLVGGSAAAHGRGLTRFFRRHRRRPGMSVPDIRLRRKCAISDGSV